jgi:hypothetical protein
MITSGFARERRRKKEELVVACVTMNDTSERKDAGRSARFARTPVRLLGLGYSIAAAALTFKNKPSLRLMTVIAAVAVLAITLFSSDHMTRASLAWCLLFLLVNILQFFLILWEMRPVELQGDARTLHDFVFPNLTASAFNNLLRFAQWRDGRPGDMLANQGSHVTEIIVLLNGNAKVERDGQHVTTLGAGAIIGEIGSLSGKPFSSTISLARHSRYLVWEKAALDHFFACHPSIASGFERAFISRLEATPAFRRGPAESEFES